MPEESLLSLVCGLKVFDTLSSMGVVYSSIHHQGASQHNSAPVPSLFVTASSEAERLMAERASGHKTYAKLK